MIQTNNMRILKSYPFILTLIFGASLLTACSKIDNNDNQPISALTVVNAFSGTGSIDFYLDYNRVNVSPWDYKLNTGYFNIYPGARNIKVSNGLNSNEILARTNYNFPEGKFISLFIAPKLESNADSAVFVVAIDSLVQTETGKASLRFVNLTPGARKLDVTVKDSPNLLFSSREFKSVTDFVTVNPSANYILQIREAGTDGAPKLELAPFAVEAGKIYTVYSNGLWNGTGSSSFGASVIVNYN